MDENKRASLYLVEDDTSLRDSLCQAFLSLGYQVFAFEGPTALLDHQNIQWPAVLISDVRMPGQSGVDLQRDLLEAQLGLPVIFISGQSTVEEAILGMKQGAVDFLLKPFAFETLVSSVEHALENQRRHHSKTFAESARRERLMRLAPREREACQLMALGYANAKIAMEMDLSLETVKQYKKNVYAKLGLEDLAELIAFMRE